MSRCEWGLPRVAAALMLTAAMACGGCGSSEPEAAAGGASQSGGKPGGAKSSGTAAGMVAAVSATRTPSPVDVRFALAGKPVVGQPVDVNVLITPTLELDRLYARFQTAEGVDLVKGNETAHLERPAIGTGVPHTVTVMPKGDGIFYVTATVVTDSPSDSTTWNFSMPIIAGAGLPELPAQAPTPAPGAKPRP